MKQLKDYIRPTSAFIPRSSLSIVKTDTDILCGAYGLSSNSGAALNFLKLYFPSIVKHIDNIKTEAYAKFIWVRCYNSVPPSLFKEFEDKYFDEIYFEELKETLKMIIDLDRVCDGLKLCFYSWLMESTPEEIKTILLRMINMSQVANIETIGTRQLINTIYDHRYERHPNIRFKNTERNAVLNKVTSTTIYDMEFIDLQEVNKYNIEPMFAKFELKNPNESVICGTICMILHPTPLSPVIGLEATLENIGTYVVGKCNKYYQTSTGFFISENDVVIIKCDLIEKEVNGYVRLSKQHLEFELPSTFSKVRNTIPRGSVVRVTGISRDGEYYQTRNGTYILSNNIEYTYSYDLLYRIKPKVNVVTLVDHEDGSKSHSNLSCEEVYDVSEIKNGYLKIEPELGWLKISTAYEKVNP